MILRFFDFEVFPHWWLMCYGDIDETATEVNEEETKRNIRYITSDDFDARGDMIKALTEPDRCITGYNIKGYDLVIANAIKQGFSPEQVAIVSELIINPKAMFNSKEHLRLKPFATKRLQNVFYQDLMDDCDGSLKDKENALGLSIVESSVPFDTEELTVAQKDEVIYYCKHDVYSSMVFFVKVLKGYTNTKLAIGKTFNLPERSVRASTNAKLIAAVLKANPNCYIDEERIDIELPPQIKEYCEENLDPDVLKRLMTSKDPFKVNLFENTVNFGNGGIHSVLEENLYVEADDYNGLYNVDAASYYPSLMIAFNLLSRNASSIEQFKDIFDERIAIKHKKDKTAEDEIKTSAYKLILNTTFGASGNKYIELYDPYMCTKVCRVGQIFLASLASKLQRTIPGLKIIQTNTDGILVYMPRMFLNFLQDCMNEWTHVSGINMELEEVVKIWQKNVNNYLMVELEDGKEKIKCKGAWLNTELTKKGSNSVAPLQAFVCTKAARNYLLKGKDIVESIYTDKNLSDFVISCVKGPTFKGVVQRIFDGSEEELQRSNRVIAVVNKTKGKLFKYKMKDGERQYFAMPDTPEFCKVVNESLDGYNFREIQKQLDYMYYIERTLNLLDVEWKQIVDSNVCRTFRFDY